MCLFGLLLLEQVEFVRFSTTLIGLLQKYATPSLKMALNSVQRFISLQGIYPHTYMQAYIMYVRRHVNKYVHTNKAYLKLYKINNNPTKSTKLVSNVFFVINVIIRNVRYTIRICNKTHGKIQYPLYTSSHHSLAYTFTINN